MDLQLFIHLTSTSDQDRDVQIQESKCQERQVSSLNLDLSYLLLSIHLRDSGGMKCLGHSRNVCARWIREG